MLPLEKNGNFVIETVEKGYISISKLLSVELRMEFERMSNATVNVSRVATTMSAVSVDISDRGYKMFRFVPTVYKRVNKQHI